ncbi:hypothetical protein VTO73DRAFT_10356 [Trametes versicolor]
MLGGSASGPSNECPALWALDLISALHTLALAPSAGFLKPDEHPRTTQQHVPSPRPASCHAQCASESSTVLSSPRLRASAVRSRGAFSRHSDDDAFARPASDSASRGFADEQFRAGARNPQLAVTEHLHRISPSSDSRHRPYDAAASP